MAKTRPSSRNIVKGIVIANGWDNDGNVIGVAIYSDNEEIYQIDPSEHFQELLGNLQKSVRVVGEIIKVENNQKRLAIDSLRVVTA